MTHQQRRRIIPLEECLDIVLTSGLLRRKGTISRPSTKAVGSSSSGSSSSSPVVQQSSCSIKALDQLLAENPLKESPKEEYRQQTLDTGTSSSPLENVDDIVASTTELTEVCSRITATTSATSTDHINNSKMKDVLSVSEVFANASTQRVRKLYANLDVFHTSMDLEEKS